MYRGSRKHILDWTAQPTFATELLQLLEPLHCRLEPRSVWMPVGYKYPDEARLETFGPRAFPNHIAWSLLSSWWLRHPKGANTPNWDIALRAELEGQPGLVLVEAKAHAEELLNSGPKRLDGGSSAHSQENDAHIRQALKEARDGLEPTLPGICIDCHRHYQLSNRIAFGWKLAALGIPTVIVYLGFLNDGGIADVGQPLIDNTQWQAIFSSHLAEVCPESILAAPIATAGARMWLLARSRLVMEQSPPPDARPRE
jgi:hypothetical protein